MFSSLGSKNIQVSFSPFDFNSHVGKNFRFSSLISNWKLFFLGNDNLVASVANNFFRLFSIASRLLPYKKIINYAPNCFLSVTIAFRVTEEIVDIISVNSENSKSAIGLLETTKTAFCELLIEK